ncbi:sulfatase [Halovenus halobia]|uniref:sulfatase n=1 Tax=Halovenus halobia TaxID=3396622 RepID=UPI003F57A76C
MNSPNIVLIVMDTARADTVNLLNEQTPMPELAKLTHDGVTFPMAHANAPWTLPSHGTIFSGQYPSVHQSHAARKLFDHEPTLAQLLRQNGYGTAAVSNNTWISGEFGFDRGFDDFYETWQLFQDGVDFGDIAQTESGKLNQIQSIAQKFTGNPIKNLANLIYGKFFRKRDDDGARRTNNIISNHIEEWLSDGPLFLFVNYLEPHLKYHPPDRLSKQYLPDGTTIAEAKRVNQDAWKYITGEVEMTQRDFTILRGLYRAELAYLDERIAELQSLFEKQGVADETVFIITGDHGENIGEHGLMDHQYSLHETLLNIPLLISGPNIPKGEVVEKPVGLVDIAPTILEIGDVPVPEDIPGHSLVSAENIPDDRSLFAEYLAPQPDIETLQSRYDCKNDVRTYNRRLRSVIQNEWKYIHGSDGSEWLFNLEDGESENRVDQDSTKGDHLAAVLDSWVDELPETNRQMASMSQSTEQRLEDLGYLQ